MTRLAIFGATGYAGTHIITEASDRGHDVVAITRGTGTIPQVGNVNNRTGTLYDRSFVLDVTAATDVLICAIPARPDAAGHTLVDATPHLVDASRQHGIRIAVVGGASSLLLSPGGEMVFSTLKDVLPPELITELTCHMRFLDALRATPAHVDWFYLSPPQEFGAHVPGEKLGHYRTGGDVLLRDDSGRSAISGSDYATAFLDEIDNPKHPRQRFTVAY